MLIRIILLFAFAIGIILLNLSADFAMQLQLYDFGTSLNKIIWYRDFFLSIGSGLAVAVSLIFSYNEMQKYKDDKDKKSRRILVFNDLIGNFKVHLYLTYGILVENPNFHPFDIFDGIELEKIFTEDYYKKVSNFNLNVPTKFKENKSWLEYINDRVMKFEEKTEKTLNFNEQYFDVKTLTRLRILNNSDFVKSLFLNGKFIEIRKTQTEYYMKENTLNFFQEYINDCINIIIELEKTKNR